MSNEYDKVGIDYDRDDGEEEEETDEDEGEEEEEVVEEEAEVEEETNYYERNTSSFRCLKEILLSSSSLMRNALYHFPSLQDPGLDDAFNYVEPTLEPDDVGVEVYVARCKDYNIVPLSAVIKGLASTTLDLKYYGLNTKQIRAITESLRRNRHVIELIIDDNQLTVDDCDYLNESLLINSTVKRLKMRGCQIGPSGAKKLIDFVEATSIVDLDLRENGIGDAGMMDFGEALCVNTSIKCLDLSRNHLGEISTNVMAKIFETNETIESLDISWNEIYTPIAMKRFFDGLSLNTTIKSLNIAWNGFGLVRESVIPLCKYLKSNETLERLDLSSNRLFQETLMMVARVLCHATTLKAINLSNNVIRPADAYLLGNTLLRTQCLLEMNLDCYVNKDFLPLLRRIKRRKKLITIDGVLSNYKIIGPDQQRLLLDRVDYLTQRPKKKKKRIDFGQYQFNLPDEPVSRDDLVALLKKGKLKMLIKDKDLIDQMARTFVMTPTKKIDCAAIKSKWMEMHPDTKKLPAQKQKKKKKGKGRRKAKKSEKDGDGAAAAAAASGVAVASTVAISGSRLGVDGDGATKRDEETVKEVPTIEEDGAKDGEEKVMETVEGGTEEDRKKDGVVDGESEVAEGGEAPVTEDGTVTQDNGAASPQEERAVLTQEDGAALTQEEGTGLTQDEGAIVGEEGALTQEEGAAVLTNEIATTVEDEGALRQKEASIVDGAVASLQDTQNLTRNGDEVTTEDVEASKEIPPAVSSTNEHEEK